MEKHVIKKLASHKRLAQERTILANERNTLAYIRTGFGAFVLGIAIIKFFGGTLKYTYAGYGAIFLGVILILTSLFYHQKRKKKILSY